MPLKANVWLSRAVRGAMVLTAAMLWAMPQKALAAASVPDWVKAAAQQVVPDYPPTTKAVILLKETVYTVGTDGRAVEHVREVVKVLRPQGREEAVPVVPYDKDRKILSMHVWSIGPDGHEYVVKDDEISDFASPGEGGQLYSDERYKVMVNAPGRDPGGVVAFEFERRERPYIAETTWSFQGDLPRLKQNFMLVLPEGYTHTTTWAHHAAEPGADLEPRRWRWEMNQQAAIDLSEVPLSPAAQSLAARMTVHYAGPALAVPQEGSWKGIGEWYETISRDRLVATPEIAAKAAELTAGKTDFYDKTEAIAEYVQQKIRYFAVEMGIGGYQPHAASEIYRGKYGDCKDKATLMSAMLSSVGVHGALVMVDTERGVIDPEAPSIAGNHMIGAIEIPPGYESKRLRSVITAKTGKRYLIFDPTWSHTPYGQLENNLQGSYGVLMEGKDSQVVKLPVLDPELNTVRRSASFELQPDGVLRGNVTERRFGDVSESLRYVFTHEDAKGQQHYFDNLRREDFTAATVTDIKVEDAAHLNKAVVTTYALEASNFATKTGPLLMVRPRVLGSYSFPVDRKHRKVPVNFEETMRGSDEFEIALPEGYVVDELPDPVKLDMGFASYESATVVKGKTLHYSRTFTMKQVTLPADRYGDVQKLASVIRSDEANRVVLKKAP